ncbi:hypothetical protein CANCADRAFT_3382 [Tortispora caseinolytica NRRL Y-17796]|uniref:Origin recognition complex subunit 4 n=1 Tax=Tortispora caseinolytica NRRL Y-17796 TaxID=767744 RepID=A0A1E4TAF2_9ASCO|nr:hypothetical protein CANCADRAFT_3382 [Tortispora caseinolytica NRRL Y-17796]
MVARPKLIGLEPQFDVVYDMLEQVLLSRKGDSLFVAGQRGSGKSTLIDAALEQLYAEFPNKFVTVRVTGCAFQEDQSAFQSICDQLMRFYHAQNNLEPPDKSSFALSLEELYRTLIASPDPDSVLPIFVIIDDVEYFARRNKQSLLYNLLDMARSSKVPIAVIGATSVLSISLHLEKRVYSRFSQRTLLVTPASSIEQFWRICKETLALHAPAENSEEWIQALDEIVKTPKVQALLRFVYHSSCDPRQFVSYWFPTFKAERPTADLVLPLDAIVMPSLEDTLLGLSEAEIIIYTCAARAHHKTDRKSINYNLTMDEYANMFKQIRGEILVGSNPLHDHINARDPARNKKICMGKLSTCASADLHNHDTIA